MATTEADVTEILGVLDAAGADPRLAGGWGIDALVGRQTREHRDLDVMVLAHRIEATLESLQGVGFVVTTDWFPVRVEVSRGDRHVDLHPLHREQDRHDLAVLDGLRENA